MAALLLRIAGLVDDSIVDGPGLRLTVFTQGCRHNCPGCHNPETHDPEAGQLEKAEAILGRYAENPLLAGITFSGGEPFLQPAPLAWLGREVHALGGDVVTYTGYLFEQLAAMEGRPDIAALLEETDLLVDGPYLEKERSLDLLFRGSANQRLLDRASRARILAEMTMPKAS